MFHNVYMNILHVCLPKKIEVLRNEIIIMSVFLLVTRCPNVLVLKKITKLKDLPYASCA